jgi:YHS domain-containing protein
MQVDENKNLPTSTYHGTKYTFCAQSCKEKFDRNPQQYISQTQQGGQSQQQGGRSGQQQQERTRTGGSGAGGGA